MTTTANQLDLGKLEINNQIYVGLLPTIASSVIVKYDPAIQVSCLVPSREYEAAFGGKHTNKKIAKVKAPSLLMSCSYGDIPSPVNFKHVAGEYGLYAYDASKPGRIFATPYVLSNIWEHGKICFGSLKPTSLRQAFNYYWGSGFNTDLLKTTHICKNKRHDNYYHVGCRCERKKTHSCSCPKEISHSHFGCGCNTQVLSKKCRGTCGEEKAKAINKNCHCCLAINNVVKKAKKKDPEIKKRKLALLAKEAPDGASTYPDCLCTFKHKKSCPCKPARYSGMDSCSCPCGCNCCLKKCQHLTCSCACCKNTCGCRCACSDVQKLGAHLENYHETLKSARWSDFTSTFCGTKYWASPKSSEGILISSDKSLLLRIPREFWRKDKNGLPLVICLANKVDTHWKFESGGYSFILDEKFVITK